MISVLCNLERRRGFDQNLTDAWHGAAQHVSLAAADLGDSEEPEEAAFYYVRVIEIPKPRWTAYDAQFFGIDMDEAVPRVTRDRAYTSPIWYTPPS